MWRFLRTYGYGVDTGTEEIELEEEKEEVVVLLDVVMIVVGAVAGELTTDGEVAEGRGSGVDEGFIVVFFGEPATLGGAPKPVHMEGRGIVRDYAVSK